MIDRPQTLRVAVSVYNHYDKRMTLSCKQRKLLEKYAQSLNPVVLVGGGGVTDALIAQVENAITAQELVKVKFNEYKEEKQELTAKIAEATGATLVRIIGNIAILYRAAKAPDKRRYEKELSKA